MLKKLSKIAPRGQSLVEFAFSVVFILILLAAAVDAARAFFVYMAIRDAAQEGAIFASVDPCSQSIAKDRVINASDQVRGLGLSSGDIVVCIPGGAAACAGNPIKIQVTYNNFRLTMPFLATFIGTSTIPMKVTVTDTILTPNCTSACTPAPSACP